MAILLEILKLVRCGTKALVGEELVWFENLGLANEEVASVESLLLVPL